MDNKNAAVKMRNISKSFGTVKANDKIWLDIYRGEILALLGENGSGKTTLMNMLSGIYFPDEGEIRYSVAQVKEACKKLPVGYRVILSLYLFEGYDMEEIASILKIQPPSVRSQYLRAKRKLLDIIAVSYTHLTLPTKLEV